MPSLHILQEINTVDLKELEISIIMVVFHPMYQSLIDTIISVLQVKEEKDGLLLFFSDLTNDKVKYFNDCLEQNQEVGILFNLTYFRYNKIIYYYF